VITDHVFRIFGDGQHGGLCAYMNCRRPRAEHERVWRPRSRQRKSVSAL
jgi:hypothetical protein